MSTGRSVLTNRVRVPTGEAAEALGVSSNEVRRLINVGDLEAITIRGRFMVLVNSIKTLEARRLVQRDKL